MREKQRKMCRCDDELNSVMLTTAMSMTMTQPPTRASEILHLQIQITRKLLTFHPFYIYSFNFAIHWHISLSFPHLLSLSRSIWFVVGVQWMLTQYIVYIFIYMCDEMLILTKYMYIKHVQLH